MRVKQSSVLLPQLPSLLVQLLVAYLRTTGLDNLYITCMWLSGPSELRNRYLNVLCTLQCSLVVCENPLKSIGDLLPREDLTQDSLYDVLRLLQLHL